MRATRITLKNWMGIESKAFDIGEGGVLIKGKNRSGKTSIMQAFVSALTGAGIDPDHIRTGADKAEALDKLAALSPEQLAKRLRKEVEGLVGTEARALRAWLRAALLHVLLTRARIAAGRVA